MSFGLRLMVILAFVSGKSEVDSAIVNAVTALLNYQYRVRQEFQPIVAHNQEARLEGLIYQQFQRKGSLTKRELNQAVGGSRFGSVMFNRVFDRFEGGILVQVSSDGRAQRFALRGKV